MSLITEQIKSIKDRYATLEASLVNARQAPRDEVTQFKKVTVAEQLDELSAIQQLIESVLESSQQVCHDFFGSSLIAFIKNSTFGKGNLLANLYFNILF